MNEITSYTQLEPLEGGQFSLLIEDDSEKSKMLAQHKLWLNSIRHERPNVAYPYKVGIYIRYFNQTKYDNYLFYHKKVFSDAISLCPKWTLADFYIDNGSSTPNMESAPEWSRLLDDCFSGKVDLIITQKVSNVSKDMDEITFCSRLLAAHTPPIGIYFVSEDIFTLASYYQADLKDPEFLPSPEWKLLPDEADESGDLSND